MNTTVILGASAKPNRYANMAQALLTKKGYTTLPVHPMEKEILGVPVYPNLHEIKEEVHTLTVYINTDRLAPLIDDIIQLAPRRIIFNPGTEAPEHYHLFPEHIILLEACTLVMLNLGSY